MEISCSAKETDHLRQFHEAFLISVPQMCTNKRRSVKRLLRSRKKKCERLSVFSIEKLPHLLQIDRFALFKIISNTNTKLQSELTQIRR